MARCNSAEARRRLVNVWKEFVCTSVVVGEGGNTSIPIGLIRAERADSGSKL